MARFCRLKQQIECLGKDYENWFGLNSINCKRRRFGVTSSGSVVQLDDWGEPTLINEESADLYQDIIFEAKLDKKILENNIYSNIGGIDDAMKELIVLQIKLSEDIQENDLIEYPIDSNDWYKVEQFLFKTKRTRYLKAYSSIRDSK